MSKLLDFDNFSGIKEEFVQDKATGIIRVKKSQNVDEIFDANLADRNNMSAGWKGDLHKIASIPLIVIEMWREELKAMGADDPNPLAKCNRNFFIAKLNNGDWSKLRTKEGRV